MWQLSHYQEHSNRALGHFLHRSETHPHKALIQCSQQLYLEFKTGTNPAWLSSVNQQLSKAWCLTPGYLSQQHKGWCRPRVNLQEAARAGKSQSHGRHAWKHAWNNKILKQNLYLTLLEVKVWMGGIGYKVATGGCLWQWIYPGFDVEVLHYDSAKSCRYRKLGKRYMSPLCVISHNCKWIINYLPLKTSGLGREPAQSGLSTQTGGPVFDPQSIQIKPQACCAGQPA